MPRNYLFLLAAILTVQSDVEFKMAVAQIQLVGVRADCAHVTIDEVDCGWCWGPDWSVRLPAAAPVARHKIVVHLIPSTFNFFGPRHHVDGDRHIVSPMQYEYIKNFADRPDAPQNTRTTFWHFKSVGIDDRLGLKAVPDLSP